MKVCREYAPCLDLPQMVNYLFLLLNQGTSVLVELSKTLHCKATVLLFTLIAFKDVFQKSSRCTFSYSFAKNEKITLQSISKTPKMLFCSICLIYDCQIHEVSELAKAYQYQYVASHHIFTKNADRKDNIINFYSQLAVIYRGDENVFVTNKCSDKCYKNLTKNRWEQMVAESRNKPFSPFFVLIFKMGVELFDYNPCQMYLLFPQDTLPKVTCCEIFFYLLQCSSLQSDLQYKFLSSQVEYLKQERSMQNITSSSRKAKKRGKNRKCQKDDNSDIFNGVCFHYFLDGIQQDIDCLDCQCRDRGYCLPECQCGPNCSIPLRGCRCKGSKCLTTCPCLKAHRICHPRQCLNCYGKKFQTCLNNIFAVQIPKLTRVGPSSIKNGGLGLFSGQFIQKNAFIMKYLGQVIEDNFIEQFRENLSYNGLFYNFKLSTTKSVDSRKFGNKSRFINHKRKGQNVIACVLKINEEDVVIFRAAKDLKEGEELYFDYDPVGKMSELRQKYPFLA